MSAGLYSGVSGLALGTGLYRNVSGLWSGASGLIDGFGGGGPFPGASLYLDFLTPTLDSRITFSRGTNATLVDSTGRITYAPANLITNSQNFSAWTLITASLTTGVTDPLGGTTAATVTATGTYGGISILTASPSSITTLVSSFWARRRTGTGNIAIYLPSGTGNSLITLTNEWQRFSIAGSPGAINSYVRVEIAVVGDAIDIAFGQLEPVTYQTTPGPYIATTTTAYYGPRFDYDPVTLAPRGLLIEDARTNLLTYSSDWTNVAWSKTNITVTPAATASPSGVIDAQRLEATAAVPTVINNVPVAVAATSATFSVYVKQGTGPNTANVFLLRNSTTATILVGGSLNYATGVWSYSTGTTGVTISNAGNGWWRVQISATSGITSGDALHGYVGWTGATAVAGEFIYAWGAQIEAGAFATSYIPTVASTVSRSFDIAIMSGTNFSSWYNQTAGTLIFNGDTYSTTGVEFLLTASDGTGSNRFGVYRSSASLAGYIVTGGPTQMEIITTNAATPNTPFEVAAGATTNDGNVSVNGNIGTTDTTISMPTVNQLGIGNNAGGGFMNGHIRAVAYYNTRLPNTQLQTLAAPSLASPLALDFLSTTYTVGY